MQLAAPLTRLRPQAVFGFAALLLVGCGGSRPTLDDDGGADAGPLGQQCQFDSDCAPPDFICATNGTCAAGCTTTGCPLTQQCNVHSGRCDNKPDGGTTDGGVDAGSDGGSDGGVASDTLCKSCSVDGDCHGGGLCVQDATHTHSFCTQDCTSTSCPLSYFCTVDRTGTKHQCYPEAGQCPGAADGGSDGGTVDDGGTGEGPSSNPSGCGFCGSCSVNDDCKTGGICINGFCAPPCNKAGFPSFECVLAGGLLGKCAVDPNGSGANYCQPVLGACLPLPGIGGDTGCAPSGTNPSCATVDLAPAMGTNVDVLGAAKPALATEDTIAADSKGNLALGYIGVDNTGSSYMGVSYSTNGGAAWTPGKSNGGKMKATTPVQSDPVIVVSKLPNGSDRMHYVWVGYTIKQSGGTATPADMFMESSYSDDGGQTWSNGVQVSTTTDNGSGSLLLDKPWVTVGPDQSLILTFSIGDQNTQDMYARISTDHGVSWGSQSYRITTGDNQHGHNLGMPVFDPNDPSGNTIYEAWITYTQIAASSANSVQLSKSTDHGHTWSQPMTVSSTDQVTFEPPSIAIDGPRHKLYVGYVASPASAGAQGAKYWDARVAAIDVGSATPSVLRNVRANDDVPAGQSAGCFQHFHSMVQVDQATGRVFCGWLDNRRANAKGGVYYSTSSDQGATWSANKRVSDTDFGFNPDHANSQLAFLGDYFGFLWDGAKLRFAWSDPRNGSSSQVFYVGGTP